MTVDELYERQYGQKKLVHQRTFPILRNWLARFDVTREDLVVELLGDGGRLLDVGCGNGSMLFKLISNCTELYGVDISPSRIEQAQTEGARLGGRAKDIHFAVGNIDTNIAFPDNHFDSAISIAVIEHVFDPYLVVGEIHRVLKPGGIAIFEVPNIAYIKYRIGLLLGFLPVTSSPLNWREIGWDGGHLHYFTKSTFCAMLEDLGFRILHVTGAGLLARLRNFYPSLLTGDICVKAQKV